MTTALNTSQHAAFLHPRLFWLAASPHGVEVPTCCCWERHRQTGGTQGRPGLQHWQGWPGV